MLYQPKTINALLLKKNQHLVISLLTNFLLSCTVFDSVTYWWIQYVGYVVLHSLFCTASRTFISLEGLLLAHRARSLFTSAQLDGVYWKHLFFDNPSLLACFPWRGVTLSLTQGAKMFESVLSTMKYISRENHHNGSSGWINGKTIFCCSRGFFLWSLCSLLKTYWSYYTFLIQS